jgi:hypothetical protein
MASRVVCVGRSCWRCPIRGQVRFPPKSNTDRSSHTRRAGTAGVYLLAREPRVALLEVQRIEEAEPPRSAFVGDAVVADGQLLVASAVDPLFVLVGALGRLAGSGQATRFVKKEELMGEDEHLWGVQVLVDALDSRALGCVCDVTENESVGTVARFNAEKAEGWLRDKTQRIAQMLSDREMRVSLQRGSQSSGFVARSGDASASIKLSAGVLWCAMVCDGVRWCVMVCYGVRWCVMVCDGVR